MDGMDERGYLCRGAIVATHVNQQRSRQSTAQGVQFLRAYDKWNYTSFIAHCYITLSSRVPPSYCHITMSFRSSAPIIHHSLSFQKPKTKKTRNKRGGVATIHAPVAGQPKQVVGVPNWLRDHRWVCVVRIVRPRIRLFSRDFPPNVFIVC